MVSLVVWLLLVCVLFECFALWLFSVVAVVFCGLVCALLCYDFDWFGLILGSFRVI